MSREAYFLSHMAGLYSILSGTWVTPVLYMLRANLDQSWRACCISYLPMRQPQNQPSVPKENGKSCTKWHLESAPMGCKKETQTSSPGALAV